MTYTVRKEGTRPDSMYGIHIGSGTEGPLAAAVFQRVGYVQNNQFSEMLLFYSCS
jgi:hypothetical protein